LCYPVGAEDFHPYVRLVTACETLLNRDVYDTFRPQCIINVSSPINAVIADVTGTGHYMQLLHSAHICPSAAFGI